MRQFIVNFLLQGQRNLSDFYSKCKQINLPAVLLFVQNERDVANVVAISVKSRWRSVNSQSGTLFRRTPNWWCVKKKRHYWPLLLEDSNVGESWIVQLMPLMAGRVYCSLIVFGDCPLKEYNTCNIIREWNGSSKSWRKSAS